MCPNCGGEILEGTYCDFCGYTIEYQRIIVYSEEEQKFFDWSAPVAISFIENIYTELLPCYIYLLKKTRDAMIVPDKHGNLVELSILPF